MNNDIKSFGFRRNLDYFFANCKVMYKVTIEYNANFYYSIISQFMYLLGMGFFLFVFSNNFGSIINWTLIDFLLFLIFTDLLDTIVGFFVWSKDIFSYLKSGKINTYLFRPNNNIFAFYFHNLSYPSFIMLIFNIIVFVIIYALAPFSLFKLLISFVILLIIAILWLVLIGFIESLNFYYLGLANPIFDIITEISDSFEDYPFEYFKNMKYVSALFFISKIYVGSLLIPFIRGYQIWNINLQLVVLFSFIFVFALGTMINWHYGLKKYEAYG